MVTGQAGVKARRYRLQHHFIHSFVLSSKERRKVSYNRSFCSGHNAGTKDLGTMEQPTSTHLCSELSWAYMCLAISTSIDKSTRIILRQYTFSKDNKIEGPNHDRGFKVGAMVFGRLPSFSSILSLDSTTDS
jgi:hypothetical protein